MLTQYLVQWFRWMEGSQPALSLPLLAVGAGLMIFGWRIWRVAVATAYGIGVAVVAHHYLDIGDKLVMAAIVGVMAGLVVWQFSSYAVVVLGGCVGAMFTMNFAEGSGVLGWPLIVAAILGLVAGYAIAYINQQQVVIVLTSVQGSLLFMTGLLMLMAVIPGIYGVIRENALSSSFVGFFILLVPTVVSCFYQMADARKTGTHFSQPGGEQAPLKAGGI